MKTYIDKDALLSAANEYEWASGLKTVLKRIPEFKDNKSMVRLDTCPFCGSIHTRLVVLENGGVFGGCVDCGCRTNTYVDPGFSWWSKENVSAVEKVIKDWNRRTKND